MSTSPFSNLPPELISQIFECADDFSVVAALAKTASIFYYTWRENTTSICRAVAPRVISNISDAERLLDMQEKAEAGGQSQDNQEQKAIIRARRLLRNARCCAAATENWVDFCQIQYYPDRGEDRGEDPHMRPSETARFEHTFYCVWTIGVMANTPHLRDQASSFLDECSGQELFRLHEMAFWASNYNDNEFGSTGLDFQHATWKAGYELVNQRWYAFSKERGMGYYQPDNHLAPMGFWSWFDHTQKYLEAI